MERVSVRICIVASLILVLACVNISVAQGEDAAEQIGVGAILGLGSELLPDDDDGRGANWQALTLTPQISFGKFSLGLSAKLRFRFDGGPYGTEWEIREEDWIPNPEIPGRSALDLLLPIIQFVRYGTEADPLVIRVGSFDGATLGSGFLVGNYSNTQLLPDRRLFGITLGLDGEVFNFPAVGLEAVIGHVPALDLVGVRFYARPLHGLDLPILSSFQIGATAAADFEQYW